MVTEKETRCGIDLGWDSNRVLYTECYDQKVGRYIHVIPVDGAVQVGLAEIVVHASPVGEVGPDFYNDTYIEPADDDGDGVLDMCGM